MGKGRSRAVRGAGGRPQVVTPEKTRKAEADLALFARDAMRGAPHLEPRLSLTITVESSIPDSWPKKKMAAMAEKPNTG